MRLYTKKGMLLLLLISIGLFLHSQQPWTKTTPPRPQQITKVFVERTGATEVCSNSTDDDGNVLVDCDDFSCYFNSQPSGCLCQPNNVIWAHGANSLLWINVQTGLEHFVGNLPLYMSDITWTVSGKLYGISDIYYELNEIDPYTADTTFVRKLPLPYRAANGMTSDSSGNLYISAYTTTSQWHVIKLDLRTGLATMIADLSGRGLSSSGDLTFLNGALYVMCDNFALAKINTSTGSVQVFAVSGMPSNYIFGMVSTGDGYLYLGSADELYRLDTLTMQAVRIHRFINYLYIQGMANYYEPCNAPVCRATISIQNQSVPPFCYDTGVMLKANGSGIEGGGNYTWTLPDATQVSEQSITSKQSGLYKAKYYSLSDAACAIEDTISVRIIKSPLSYLPEDTLLCAGSQATLQPLTTEGITSYLWQDGSVAPTFTVTSPGLYWLQASNACGFFRDSVQITGAETPQIDLGPSREICQSDTLHLSNKMHASGYSYNWSNNSFSQVFIINSPGIYWAEVENICGVVSDTIIITKKVDGCECFLHVPSAFTPNGDGKNDLLKVSSECPIQGEFSIYNRWGELIYHTRNLSEGWDGRYKNILQTTGIFVYYIRYSYLFRTGVFNKKGTVTVIQ